MVADILENGSVYKTNFLSIKCREDSTFKVVCISYSVIDPNGNPLEYINKHSNTTSFSIKKQILLYTV